MKSIILLIFIALSLVGIAQKTITEVTIDNDLVFLNDRYYSSGISLGLYSNWLQKSPINKILLPNKPNEVVYYALLITHNMYTPDYTYSSDIQFADHPYATYLLMGNKKISFDLKKRIKKTSILEVGIIGPSAGGEIIQNKSHEYFPAAKPSEGWHNQIQNDLCIQYSATIEKGIINLSMLELNGTIKATIGVPHTEAQIGAYTRFGFFNDYFRGIGIDISPDLHIWLYLGGSVYIVNYNATLQGGTFSQNNVHTINQINNALLHGRFGGVLQFRRINVEYGMEVSSPEFYNAYWHRWGHLSVSVAF